MTKKKLKKTLTGPSVLTKNQAQIDSDFLKIKQIEGVPKTIKDSLDEFELNFKIERNQPKWP